MQPGPQSVDTLHDMRAAMSMELAELRAALMRRNKHELTFASLGQHILYAARVTEPAAAVGQQMARAAAGALHNDDAGFVGLPAEGLGAARV